MPMTSPPANVSLIHGAGMRPESFREILGGVGSSAGSPALAAGGLWTPGMRGLWTPKRVKFVVVRHGGRSGTAYSAWIDHVKNARRDSILGINAFAWGFDRAGQGWSGQAAHTNREVCDVFVEVCKDEK